MPRSTVAVATPPPSGFMEELVETYLGACRAKGLSPKTIKLAYGYPLRGVFLPWCAEHAIDAPSKLTTRLLEGFASDLMEHGGKRGQLSRSTVWTYVKAVRSFLSWVREEGERVEAEARLPKLPRRLVQVLSRQEIERLEAIAAVERDKLIVRLLADTGVRVGELIKLTPADLIERDRNLYLRVEGKDSRERLVPVGPTLARRLRTYADRGRPTASRTDRLFPSRRIGLLGTYRSITENGVQQMIRDLGEKAGLAKRVHPHLFRHSAATYMLQRGMNPLLVAQVLGHTSLAMIQRVYAHLTPTDAHQALMQVLEPDE